MSPTLRALLLPQTAWRWKPLFLHFPPLAPSISSNFTPTSFPTGITSRLSRTPSAQPTFYPTYNPTNIFSNNYTDEVSDSIIFQRSNTFPFSHSINLHLSYPPYDLLLYQRMVLRVLKSIPKINGDSFTVELLRHFSLYFSVFQWSDTYILHSEIKVRTRKENRRMKFV